MARAIKRLTARSVETARKPGLLADGAGLYLHVRPSGAKSWIFRWRRDGRLRDMGLGPLSTFGLAAARDKAAECRRLVYDGADPIGERRAKRQAARVKTAKTMKFRQCAETLITARRAGLA